MDVATAAPNDKKQVRLLVVDGEIAAGKSTFCEQITAYLNSKGVRAVCVLEPVDEWIRTGTLDRFYENPSMYIFEGQIYIMSTLVRAFDEARRANPDAEVFVLERSVETCRHVFYEIIKTDLVPGRREMFESFYRWLVEPNLLYNKYITKHVYLKPSIETCQERLRIRNRDAETTVSAEYQSKLREKTTQYLDSVVGSRNVMILDRNDDAAVDYRGLENAGVTEFFDRVIDFLHQDS